MATTSPTWNFEASAPLIGVGVDAEELARFAKLDLSANPLPLVFSARESSHLVMQATPARAYCAAFSCKEALLKALGEPYNPHDCEALFVEGQNDLALQLGADLRAETGVEQANAHVQFNELDECIVMVYAFGHRPLDMRT